MVHVMLPKPSSASTLLRRAVVQAAHGWFLLSRGMTLGVRAAILRDDAVFLIRHAYAPGWQLPGGGVEVGEDALEALRREVREEAAIAVGGTAPRLHGVFLNRHVSRRDHVLVYAVRDFEVIGPKAPDREIADARFWPLAALPADVTRGTRDRLDEIASGREPPPFW